MIAMEVPEYRRRYEAELAKAAPPKERGRAAARAKAIAAAPLEEESLPEQVAELLATLHNRKEPRTVRMAALQALGALDFLGPRFAPFRADYKQALREIATDPERELREARSSFSQSTRIPTHRNC